MVSEDELAFELKEKPSLLFNGSTSKIHRFKVKAANKVNFRDDTLIQRRCHSEEECTTAGRLGDLEMGLGLPNDDDFELDENQLTVMTLPAEFMRRPSMVSMRMKRDQLFQGTRTRRTPRLIFKDGFMNITFRKIPERSMLFCKDFVTTLVRRRRNRYS